MIPAPAINNGRAFRFDFFDSSTIQHSSAVELGRSEAHPIPTLVGCAHRIFYAYGGSAADGTLTRLLVDFDLFG